ncbi:MAG: patatin-like phospholipase family protein, partial [Candidatus Cloacimonetes bacterium]|nr:patatin-like phospholipase family protein [Candidatus Cloacimonadota bacterium]
MRIKIACFLLILFSFLFCTADTTELLNESVIKSTLNTYSEADTLSTKIRNEGDRPRVALVLSGGGAKGLAHIGVIKVLEEYGIYPDIITGTSMGSIIGGLYSIGYNGNKLDEAIRNIDWDNLLMDRIPRTSISIEEKADFGRFVVSFPIKGFSVKLPKGLVAGQNISSLISELMLSAHHITDFDNLPIPFKCVATNIATGEAVILEKGFLPDAIRASMSIPSAFTPVEIDGKLLVDGGLVMNLPVSLAKSMGADFIIAVDVSSQLKEKDELNSFVRVIEQSFGLQSYNKTLKERELCDILILPDVDNYNMMSFGEYDSLFCKGTEAARKVGDQLQELSERLKEYPEKDTFTPLLKVDSLFITNIVIEGLDKVSKNLIIGKLKIQKNTWISPADLNAAIERIYGSQFFERITYKFIPQNNGVVLYLRLIEQSDDFFRAGLHYDSDMKTSLILNTTYRNFLLEGTKLSMSLNLGENVAYDVSYFIHTGWKPGFGIGLRSRLKTVMANLYLQGDYLEATYDTNIFTQELELQTIYSNSFTISGGIRQENTLLQPEVAPAEYHLETEWEASTGFYGYLLIDTLDRLIYPRKGIRLNYEIYT